jgi:chemotaxis protein MotB
MLKKIAFLFIVAFSLNACVSKKVYQELETKFNKLRTSNAALIKEKDDLLAAKKQLETDFDALNAKYDALKTQNEILNTEYTALQSKHQNLQESYDVLSTQSSNKLAEQAAKNQELLKQLEEKEQKLAAESIRLEKLQKELAVKAEQIDELQALISAKEAQMQKLKTAISDALLGFEGKGLTVEHKNGKIYVSMENKLLFSSGSWAVGTEGKDAVEKLADVLAENTDINVLIEGHTDNVPYKGATLIDNWDLSVKRATAIVRILESKGVSPKQITAAGRSKYVPVDTNETTEGKAKNRRIEIILAPNLDEISKLLNE